MSAFEKEQKEIVREKSDAFMKQIACIIAEENLREYENARDFEDCEAPGAFDDRMAQMIRDAERAEQRARDRSKWKRWLHGLIRVAVILLVCTMIGGIVLVASVDAFRIRMMNFFIDDHGEYVDVSVMESGSLPKEVTALLPSDWNSLFYPMWLPEKYELESVNGIGDESRVSRDFVFISDDGDYLTFGYNTTGASGLMIDNEETVKGEITVGQYNAVYFLREERVILVWDRAGNTFMLVMEGQLEEAVRAAESVAYIHLK